MISLLAMFWMARGWAVLYAVRSWPVAMLAKVLSATPQCAQDA
jgi:hypothetical protein